MDIDIVVAIIFGFIAGAYIMMLIMAALVASSRQDAIEEFRAQNFLNEKRDNT